MARNAPASPYTAPGAQKTQSQDLLQERSEPWSVKAPGAACSNLAKRGPLAHHSTRPNGGLFFIHPIRPGRMVVRVGVSDSGGTIRGLWRLLLAI